MDWVLAAAVAVAGALVSALAYRLLFAPADVAHGRQEVADEQRTKADALKVGVDAVTKLTEHRINDIDKRAAADKARSPVDVANDIIKEKP